MVRIGRELYRAPILNKLGLSFAQGEYRHWLQGQSQRNQVVRSGLFNRSSPLQVEPPDPGTHEPGEVSATTQCHAYVMSQRTHVSSTRTLDLQSGTCVADLVDL